ncbi:MAG: LPS export ABC transporter permease LptF [Gammaproteobacteria bacterium RIFCSPLOWO2_02_FULL_57_10]|nr:MAG: LPS export ABC transporter permease LptF [Gammaproteobacteria bacterium RIFCSPLOWO2_02_FULL_57_10]
MIIIRYLGRQILQVMAAVTVILLVVAMITRFLQYLGQAVAGEITSDILLLLMLYRLPEFLLVILPFALFLAILLAYGRMYADNEMTVLGACGMSQRRLVVTTLLCSSIVAVIVGALSLQVAPRGLQNTEQLMQSQEELTELDLIVAGQFQDFADGLRTTYAETISVEEAGRQINNTFVAWRRPDSNESEAGVRIIVAESARPVIEEASGRRFMLLENGYLYDGVPGQADYLVTQFQEQALLLPEQAPIENVVREKALPTEQLWRSEDPEQQAELQWRFSVMLLIPVLTLIAVPLSRVDPRQGRYSKLVPAAIIYAGYYVLLQVAMDLTGEGDISPMIGLWWVHGLFLLFGLYLLFGLPGRRRSA